MPKDGLPGLHVPDHLSGCGGQTKRHLLLKHPLGLPRQMVVDGHLTVNERIQGEEKRLCPGPGQVPDDQSPVRTQTVGNDLLVEVPRQGPHEPVLSDSPQEDQEQDQEEGDRDQPGEHKIPPGRHLDPAGPASFDP